MKKFPVLSVWKRRNSPLKKFFSHTKFLKAFLLLVIAASIPLTVYVANQRQEIRQHAATTDTICTADCDNGHIECIKKNERTNWTNCRLFAIDTYYSCLVICKNEGRADDVSCKENCNKRKDLQYEGCESDYNSGIKTCDNSYNSCKSSCTIEGPSDIVSPAPHQAASGQNPKPLTPYTNGAPPRCDEPDNNCIYSESKDVCYSGHTDEKVKDGTNFNVKGCSYTCKSAKVTCPTTDTKTTKNTSSSKGTKPAPGCTPGEAINSYTDLPCPNGKKGTCAGHSYCEWNEGGNLETAPICETEKQTCGDTGSNSTEKNACKDNPVDPPPGGYKWKSYCDKKCSKDSECDKNTKDSAVNPENSAWCYSGSCLQLVTDSGSSSHNKKVTPTPKKKKDDSGSNPKGSKSGNKSNALSNKGKNSGSKNTKTKGTPTPTPKKGSKITPTPKTGTSSATTTPAPALSEPINLKGFCGPTTSKTQPLGIKVTWDSVKDASRYAIRIDEDAPSWEGDNPSPGDTVDNTLTKTSYVRAAKYGSSYQAWVHSVNSSGVYSTLSKKILITCPTEAGAKTSTASAGTVGAGELIILPESGTVAPTTNITPSPTPATTITQQKCGDKVASSGDKVTAAEDIREWDMVNTQGVTTLTYDTAGFPDRLQVYYDNKLLQDTGAVSTYGEKTTQISFGPGTSKKLKVITTAQDLGSQTIWDYSLSCPTSNTIITTPTPTTKPKKITDRPSTNWGGYAFALPSDTKTAVIDSTWNVSQVTCDDSTVDVISSWIGFGGAVATDQNIAQLGVDLDCRTNNGTPRYIAWTENFPAPLTWYPYNPISAGDNMNAKVTFQGAGKFLTTITNNTKNWTLSVPMQYPSSYIPQHGEFVLERTQDYHGNGIPKFSPATTFSKTTFTLNSSSAQPLNNADEILNFFIATSTTKQTENSPITNDTFDIKYLHK